MDNVLPIIHELRINALAFHQDKIKDKFDEIIKFCQDESLKGNFKTEIKVYDLYDVGGEDIVFILSQKLKSVGLNVTCIPKNAYIFINWVF